MSLNEIKRSRWGARPAKRRTSIRNANSLTGHYLGCDKELSDEDSSKEIQILKNTQNFHMNTKGWADIAYNWLIGQSGALYEGRGLGIQSAANGTTAANRVSYAACFMTGPNEAPTQAAVDTMNRLRIYLGFDDIKIHSEWKATACPGDHVRRLQKAGAFTGSSTPPPVSEPVTDTTENPSAEVRVRWLQAALGGLTIDGDFGPLSSARFNQNWLGDRSKYRDEVDQLLVNKPSVVSWFQAEMNRRELADIKIDGFYGPLTAASVEKVLPDSRIVTASVIKNLLSL